MELTPQNATITTATVEVKALTISGKQVTLAVFRQLPQVPLLTFGRAWGDIWGWVNYHVDPECKESHWSLHRHVVGTSRGKLYRDCVIRRPLLLNGELPADPDWVIVKELPQLFIAV